MTPPNLIKYIAVVVAFVSLVSCAISQKKKEQARAHLNIGIAYLGSAQYNEALRELSQVEEFTPQDPRVHYYMGIAYYGKRLKDKAIDQFKKALSLQSDYSEAHNFLGTIYIEKGQWDNALESFKNALSNILYETPDKALFNMGRAYYGKGDYEKALSAYREAKNKAPNTIPPALIDNHIGVAYFAQDDMKNAINYFDMSLKQAPSLVEPRYWLGQCYIKMKDLEKAKAEFQSVIKTAPESEWGIAAQKGLDAIESPR